VGKHPPRLNHKTMRRVRADPSAVRSRTALVRLLAATIGHEEPGLVLDAIRSVGLGTTTYSAHLRNLAAALAKWALLRWSIAGCRRLVR
jgi:hypothetical protein